MHMIWLVYLSDKRIFREKIELTVILHMWNHRSDSSGRAHTLPVSSIADLPTQWIKKVWVDENYFVKKQMWDLLINFAQLERKRDKVVGELNQSGTHELSEIIRLIKKSSTLKETLLT